MNNIPRWALILGLSSLGFVCMGAVTAIGAYAWGEMKVSTATNVKQEVEIVVLRVEVDALKDGQREIKSALDQILRELRARP